MGKKLGTQKIAKESDFVKLLKQFDDLQTASNNLIQFGHLDEHELDLLASALKRNGDAFKYLGEIAERKVVTDFDYDVL